MKHKSLLALLLAVCALIALCPSSMRAAEPVYGASQAYSSSRYYKRLLSVKLTGDARFDIINVAASQLGYHEGDGASELDGGNKKGSNNYSEYGYWFGRYPMGGDQGFYHAWCAFFISWCARQAAIPVSTVSNAAYARPDSASSQGGYGYFHVDAISPQGYVPQTGDLIFIDWEADGTWDHVGLVFFVDGDSISTIEGNAEDGVRQRVYSMSDPVIRAYGSPAYGDTTHEELARVYGMTRLAVRDACRRCFAVLGDSDQ